MKDLLITLQYRLEVADTQYKYLQDKEDSPMFTSLDVLTKFQMQLLSVEIDTLRKQIADVLHLQPKEDAGKITLSMLKDLHDGYFVDSLIDDHTNERIAYQAGVKQILNKLGIEIIDDLPSEKVIYNSYGDMAEDDLKTLSKLATAAKEQVDEADYALKMDR